MTRPRRGYTLMEMAVVLAIMAIAATLVVPALVDLGQSPPRHAAAELLDLLRDARAVAIDSDVTVTLLVDPVTGKYRADSAGVEGAGPVATGQLELGGSEAMVTELPRLRYVFAPTGAALADTVRVRGADSSVVVRVDPWSGVAATDVQ
jgi:prepilin-type N-terminal cleavage/methylation domain-containing protein